MKEAFESSRLTTGRVTLDQTGVIGGGVAPLRRAGRTDGTPLRSPLLVGGCLWLIAFLACSTGSQSASKGGHPGTGDATGGAGAPGSTGGTNGSGAAGADGNPTGTGGGGDGSGAPPTAHQAAAQVLVEVVALESAAEAAAWAATGAPLAPAATRPRRRELSTISSRSSMFSRRGLRGW